MTTETSTIPALSPDVRAMLGRLRARIRTYVWVQGLAASLVACGLAFWAALLIDWTFEPPAPLRVLLLIGGALAVLGVSYWYLWRRAFVPLSDVSMALLLERRFRQFDDSLLTAVELSQRREQLADLAREMLAHTYGEAAARSSAVRLGDVFDPRPLGRAIIAAIALAVSIAAFALAVPDLFQFFVNERVVHLSEAPWPRNTRLEIEGFKNREAVVALGNDLEIVVKADANMEVPSWVQIRYRTEDGRRGRPTMIQEGEAVPGRDPFQIYKYKIASIISPYQFDVVGGDARLRDYRIRVVENPTLSEMTIHCTYPEYTARAPRDLPVTGAMQLPRGSQIKVLAKSNKPLVKVQVETASGQDSLLRETIDIALPGGRGGRQEFEFNLARLDTDATIAFTLFDTDGIRTRQPIRLAITATPDEPPQLSTRLHGIGSAITPQARLPLAGEIVDDYGIHKAWFEFAVDDKPPQEVPFSVAPGGRDKLSVDEVFEVGPLEVKPGQKLLIGSKAADNHSLPDDPKPHVGQGERFLLDVVTPEQLRAILEARELNLRQRFESILQEVTDTRDGLTRLEFEAPQSQAPAEKPAASKTATDAAAPTPGGNKDEEGADSEVNSPERMLARRVLRVQSAMQASQKNAQETLGVAAAFDAIREELVNNRVDTEELKIRLKDQIADPLHKIGNEMFPEFDRRLTVLQDKLGDLPAGKAARQGAFDQADRILVEMQKVRDKMLELETFNEAVEILRGIVAAQEKVNEETKRLRTEKAKRLLKD